MSRDGQTIPDEREPAPLERGEILANIKRWALLGYRQEVGGDTEGFERRWREAFYAEEASQEGWGESG